MNARLLLLSVPLLVALFAGCLGGDAKSDDVAVEGEKEIAKGLPPKTFTFQGSPMTPSGSVEKVVDCVDQHLPWGLIYDCADQTRFTWNITGLTPVGTGDNATDIGEVFYKTWLGKPGEGDQLIWENSGQGPQIAQAGSISGDTGLSAMYNPYTAFMLTMETVNDGQPEVRLMSVEDAAEAARYDLVDLAPFTGAGGQAKVVYKNDNKDVDITITAFGLPGGTAGHYEAFLRNAEGDRNLGKVATDGGELKVALKADNFAFNWQIFVNLEGPDGEKPGPGGLRVMTSRFAS